MNIKVQSFKHLLFLMGPEKEVALHSAFWVARKKRSSRYSTLLSGRVQGPPTGLEEAAASKDHCTSTNKSCEACQGERIRIGRYSIEQYTGMLWTINDSPKPRRSATAADKFPVAVSELLSMSTLAGSSPDDKMHFYFFLSRKPEPFKTVRRLQNSWFAASKLSDMGA